jgi:hypothetical protein
MQQTPFLPLDFNNLRLTSQPVFHVFIACENQAALARAKKIENQINVLCGSDFKTSHMVWSFSLLRHTELRKHALAEASKADIILLSISSKDELAWQVRSLLEELPVRKPAGRAALIALLGFERTWGAESPSPLSYLRQLADERGLDFFCNRPVRMELPKPIFSHMPDQELTPTGILSYHIPWNSGGINE